MMALSPVAMHQPAHAINYYTIIHVLEQLEGGSWNDSGGKLHWKLETWREETKLPFVRAREPGLSRVLASQRLGRLASIARFAGHPITPELLCGFWLHGLKGALRRRDMPSDYMQRGANLYYDTVREPR